MKKMATVSAICILTIVTASTSSAFISERSRYDIILKKQPFGAPPPVNKRSADVQPEIEKPKPLSQSFARNLRLVAVRKSSRGTRVGFIDIKSKSGGSYLLYVGQQRDGITVVDADYEEEKALLEKDGEEHWIYMDGKEGIAGTTAPRASDKSVAASSKSIVNKAMASSHRARLKSRQETIRRRTVEPPPVTGEGLKKREQQFAVDVIRKGEMPPPPVRLTRENDDMLVDEGILPPHE